MKPVLLILSLFCFTIFGLSQKFSFGKVSMEEINKKNSSITLDAPAEILYKEVSLEVDIHGNLEYQVTQRVKIFNKNRAEEFLTYIVPLHKNGNLVEKISNFRASTYNSEDKKIVEVKIKNNQTITEEKHKYLDLFKFTFPDVRDGAVIEYKYTVYSPFIAEIPTQYFDDKIPLQNMSYTLKIPSACHYIPDLRGLNSNKLKIEKKSHEAIEGIPYILINLKVENVFPYEEEPFVLNYNNIRTSIRYELASIQIPGKIAKNFSTTWKEVGDVLLKSDDFGGYFNTSNQFKNILQNLFKETDSNEEKARSILHYIQDNYIWNEYFGVYANQSLGRLIKTKTGNSGDLNLLLVAMLREAGIDANPIVLSTVANGMLNYSFPSLQKLNYVIAGYYDKEQLNILDATNKFSDINQIPKRALNYRGFYIKKNEVREVNLANKIMSVDAYMLNYEIKSDMRIVGTFVNKSTQYIAMTKSEAYDENNNQFERKFRGKYNFPLHNLEFSQDKKFFRSAFSFDSVSNMEIIGNKIIFNPLLFLVEKEQIFKAETRTYPIDLGSPSKHSKIVIITLPEGYELETLPETKKYLMEGNLGSFSYIISSSGNQVQLKTELILNEFYLPSEYYTTLKEFWQHMLNSENQLISIIKNK